MFLHFRSIQRQGRDINLPEGVGSVHGEHYHHQHDDQGEEEGRGVEPEPPGLEILTEVQRSGAVEALRKGPDEAEASRNRNHLDQDTDLCGGVGGHSVR